jgi:hypothetical protein
VQCFCLARWLLAPEASVARQTKEAEEGEQGQRGKGGAAERQEVEQRVRGFWTAHRGRGVGGLSAPGLHTGEGKGREGKGGARRNNGSTMGADTVECTGD